MFDMTDNSIANFFKQRSFYGHPVLHDPEQLFVIDRTDYRIEGNILIIIGYRQKYLEVISYILLFLINTVISKNPYIMQFNGNQYRMIKW